MVPLACPYGKSNMQYCRSYIEFKVILAFGSFLPKESVMESTAIYHRPINFVMRRGANGYVLDLCLCASTKKFNVFPLFLGEKIIKNALLPFFNEYTCVSVTAGRMFTWNGVNPITFVMIIRCKIVMQ
jgi:hypothetical protein